MDIWLSWCSFDGMVLAPRTARLPQTALAPGTDCILLPSCRPHDRVLPGQPPLPVALSAADAALLRGTGTGTGTGLPLAATGFGPPQEKPSNQDAALSTILYGNGAPHAFIAVADGVTTRTFWPERSARIACLAAFATFRDLLRHGALETGRIDHYRARLSTALRQSLELDRAALLHWRAEPEGWNAALYRQHRDRLDLWYNTTLLVGCLGPQFGVLLWAGDGCIYIRRTTGQNRQVSTPLRSTQNLAISNFISLGCETTLNAGLLAYAGCQSIDLLIGTDGYDRTAQQGDDSVMQLMLASRTSADLLATLQHMWQQPHAEIDNYSVAVARWQR